MMRDCKTCTFLGQDGDCPFTWEIRKPEYPACSYYQVSFIKLWAKELNAIYDAFAKVGEETARCMGFRV